MSTLKANTFTGTTSAGSILVTGEGGSTTTNLQQGLAKVWVDYNTDSSTSISDSFNVASLTDNGTGDTTIVITNDMASVNYCPIGSTNHDFGLLMISDNGKAAGSVDVETRNVSDSLGDCADTAVSIHGDLA